MVHTDSQHSLRKAGEGTKYGLTTAQAEEFAKFYGSNVDVLFDLAKNIKTKRKNTTCH